MKHTTPFRTGRAFTLVELLVSMAIITLLLLVLVSITSSTQKIWLYSTSKSQQFREAREAFESITRRLSQATLNTYWDYLDSKGVAITPATASTFVPDHYGRQSELRFISGNTASLAPSLAASRPTQAIFFQAPLGFATNTNYTGLENVLNTWGYFIEFSDDSTLRPSFIDQQVMPYRSRFRLMEMAEPSESLTLYQSEAKAGGNALYKGTDWFTTPLANYKQVLAENIVALVILPKLSPADAAAGNYKDNALAPDYYYNSTGTGMTTVTDPNLNPKNQLPPVVQVTMVAVDETSFGRMQGGGATMPDLGLTNLFKTAGDTSDKTKQGYAQDLQTLQDNLLSKRLNYRVFTTNVSLKAAKWSRNQKN